VTRLRLVCSVPFLLSVALLALNDQLLKERWHNTFTGKLSDFTGVVVVAVLLFVAPGNRHVAVGLTAIGFTLLKVSATVALWSSPFLGGITLQDRTDLVALAVLGPVWWWLGRVAPSLSSTVSVSGPASPVLGQTTQQRVQTGGQVVAVVAALIVCSATSMREAQQVTDLEAKPDGRVALRVGVTQYESANGGASFSATSSVPADAAAIQTKTLDCAPSGECFRISASGVERGTSKNAPWVADLTYSNAELQRFESAFADHAEYGKLLQGIAVVNQPDGTHVVVNNGSNGVAHRNPNGRWSNVRVGDLIDHTQQRFPFAAMLVLPVAALLLGWWPLLRRHKTRWALVALNVSLAFIGSGIAALAFVLGTTDGNYGVGRTMTIVFSAWCVVQIVWFRWTKRQAGQPST
jgi:hypothetical protein